MGGERRRMTDEHIDCCSHLYRAHGCRRPLGADIIHITSIPDLACVDSLLHTPPPCLALSCLVLPCPALSCLAAAAPTCTCLARPYQPRARPDLTCPASSFPSCGIACISATTATLAVAVAVADSGFLVSLAGQQTADCRPLSPRRLASCGVVDVLCPSSSQPPADGAPLSGLERSAVDRLFHLLKRRPRHRHRDPNWHMPDAGLRS
ncbi:hypothetical protein V8C26DRAFT_279353 [Trichoderma gracile]